MKTNQGMEYEYKRGSPRLLDLTERLTPIVDKWIKEGNMKKGDGLTILLYPDDMDECPHRARWI